MEDLHLNVSLLRRRVPNLTVAARTVGLRPATVSDLCTEKIALGNATVRTLAALADLAACSLDDLVLRGSGVEMIETGIKVLDLFAPLVRGGSVGLVARTGVGQFALLGELLHRLRLRGFATVVWLPGEMNPEMQEAAVGADAVVGSQEDAVRQIAGLLAHRDVLVAADRATVLSGELEALRVQLGVAGIHRATFALVDALGEAPDEEVPYGPLEALWRFDVERAARGLFPAIDPVASTSVLLEGAALADTHLVVQQRARKLLRRYGELRGLVNAAGMAKLPQGEAKTYHRGERLELFLTQPFYTAERFTAIAGESVSLHEAMDDVRRILDGAVDETEATALRYVGRLGRQPQGDLSSP